jgi:glycosyltransferase involved in cell wall biosynthesis
MKLVLITDTFPPLRTSGAIQLRDLTREFARQGHDLTVLVPEPEMDQPWKLEEFAGAQLLRLRAPRTKEVGYIYRTLGELVMPFAMLQNLKKSPLKFEKWEAIIWYSPSIFHGPLIKNLKKKSGGKAYLIIRDIFPEWALDLGVLRKGPAYYFFQWIARRQYALADVIGVQSPGNRVYFKKQVEFRKGQSVEVLQNWLDKPVRLQSSIRLNEGPLSGRKILVHAGNMGIAQGMDIIMELAERIMLARNDVGFLLVGRGSEVDRLKNISVQKKLNNVFFHDEIDPDEIPDLYSQCCAGIVSLDLRHKSHNIPGKFLSYIQNGLPVLAIVNLGNDLAKIIKNEDVGVVCETGCLEEIEKKCISLLDQLALDKQLHQQCQDLFERQFSVSKTVKQLVASLRRHS